MSSIIKFSHVYGVFGFDDACVLQTEHFFDADKQHRFAAAVLSNAASDLLSLAHESNIEGREPTSPELAKIMQAVRPAIDVSLLRSVNIALTKQAIRQSVSSDLLMINAVNCIDEIDKVTNALAKRLREWYALYNPETEHEVTAHEQLVAMMLKDIDARKQESMGGSFSKEDLTIVQQEAAAILELYSQRERLLAYLEVQTKTHVPNIHAVAGAMISAKLIALAGSLARLSRLPSGTVQLLGAETALFRHLRNKNARPPKHGIIFNHVLLQRAPRNLRGKAARALADKISIAAKVDFFKGAFIGDQLYKQVEEKIQRK